MMTAYRTSPPQLDRPFVNPNLERALFAYYRRQRRRDVLMLVASCAGVLLAVAWVVLVQPPEGWFNKVVAFFGIPGAAGMLFATWSLLGHRAYLLERIRTGVPIHHVRRSRTPLRSVDDIPTIYVEFADGRTNSLYGLGDAQQMTHIEELLRRQMNKASERLYSIQ